MSKKIDFNFLHNFLQFIQAKNKWKISEILDNLDISFKELIYILDIVSQIYVDFDDVFVDYEINEDTEEINFLFNDSVYELLSINDSELFNLYYLLTIEANFLTLKDSNKEIMKFYNILSKYFNIDGLFESDDNSESFSFEEIKTIEYIKLGKTESQTYFVKPVALKLNQDGKILEALDVEENSIKTFLIDRIVGINKEENTKPKLSTRSALKVKYKIHDINFLKTLDNSTFNVINDNLEMKFYSFENALDFSLKNIQYINAITPLKLVDEIKIRQSNLLEILNEFN
tara:strand:+ start:4649 stop:5509 length:861 start_codon:yes stop_codon:yes gene_type:complete